MTTALALRVLLAAWPDHPLVVPMGRWLATERRDGTWRTTHATAHAVLALRDLARLEGDPKATAILARAALPTAPLFAERLGGAAPTALRLTWPLAGRAALAPGRARRSRSRAGSRRARTRRRGRRRRRSTTRSSSRRRERRSPSPPPRTASSSSAAPIRSTRWHRSPGSSLRRAPGRATWSASSSSSSRRARDRCRARGSAPGGARTAPPRSRDGRPLARTRLRRAQVAGAEDGYDLDDTGGGEEAELDYTWTGGVFRRSASNGGMIASSPSRPRSRRDLPLRVPGARRHTRNLRGAAGHGRAHVRP